MELSTNIGTCPFRQDIYGFVEKELTKLLFLLKERAKKRRIDYSKAFWRRENSETGITEFEDRISSESRVDRWPYCSKCVGVCRELFSGKRSDKHN